MSERDNLHIAEQTFAALNARDLDRYVTLLDNSYVGESELAPSALHGPDAARHMWETLLPSGTAARLTARSESALRQPRKAPEAHARTASTINGLREKSTPAGIPVLLIIVKGLKCFIDSGQS